MVILSNLFLFIILAPFVEISHLWGPVLGLIFIHFLLHRLFLRRGPDLTITLSSDAQFASANPVIFSAQFSVLPIRLAIERHRGYSATTSSTCPVECTVRDERRSCKLTSPAYPSVYPRGIRCIYAIILGKSNESNFDKVLGEVCLGK